MARITMECVVKSFGRTEVIKGVDLAIEDKSTLLRLVAGIGMMFARKPEASPRIDAHTAKSVALSGRGSGACAAG